MKIKGLEYNHTYKTIVEKDVLAFDDECPMYYDTEYIENPLYTAEQVARYAYEKVFDALSKYSGLISNEEIIAIKSAKIIDADWIENE